jgi:hypothetical protein
MKLIKIISALLMFILAICRAPPIVGSLSDHVKLLTINWQQI